MDGDDTNDTTTAAPPKPRPFEFKKRTVVGSKSSSFRRKKQKQLVAEPPANSNSVDDDGDNTNSTDSDVPVTNNATAATKPDDAAQKEEGGDHGKNIVIIDNDDDENDDEDENESRSALDAVLAAERRRKLLLLGRRNRGVDATSLTTSSTSNHATKKRGARSISNSVQHGDDSVSVGSERKAFVDLEERLMGGRTFAGGRSAGSNDMGGSGGDILAMKHKMAMEEFIRKNLSEKLDQTEGSAMTTYRDEEHAGEHDGQYISLTSKSAEKELYAELLLSTIDGKKRTNGSNDDGDGNAKDTKRGNEGDVGAGGAVMGGTGIAEVALPIDERLRAARATEMAALERERARAAKRNFHGGDPSSTLSSSALPNNTTFSSQSHNIDVSNNLLGASYSHNFQLHTKEWISRQRDERQIEIDALRTAREATEGNTSVENRARIGFEAARKSAKQGEGGRASAPTSINSGTADAINDPSMRNEWDRKQGGDSRSNDERVWRTFMTKQRNRR